MLHFFIMVVVPDLARELARRFEGFKLNPYHDPAGFATIGYGSLLSREKWADLSKWSPVTHKEAEALLTSDLEKAARSVLRLCPVPLTEGRFSALIDFTFNLGSGNLQISTLRKLVNRGDMDEAVEEFHKWVYAGGIKLPGLVRRRAAEAEIFK